jgi:hypothetical protein
VLGNIGGGINGELVEDSGDDDDEPAEAWYDKPGAAEAMKGLLRLEALGIEADGRERMSWSKFSRELPCPSSDMVTLVPTSDVGEKDRGGCLGDNGGDNGIRESLSPLIEIRFTNFHSLPDVSGFCGLGSGEAGFIGRPLVSVEKRDSGSPPASESNESGSRPSMDGFLDDGSTHNGDDETDTVFALRFVTGAGLDADT